MRWLQQGGVGFPPINTGFAGIATRMGRFINKVPIVRTLAGMTRLKSLLELDSFHATFLKMNASGVVFVAALNGSALAVGAEFAWACDLRIMADGDFVIGLSEVLLALTPGGGGSQRLPRLIGIQKSLVSILEGKPFTPAQALALGAVDEVVPQDKVLSRAIERAEYLSLRSKESIGAIERCKTDRILDVIRLTHQALLQMDVDNPLIGVAGLNPHCGENGLFGNEDVEQIQPAIDLACKEGIRVYPAPIPPDTVFVRMAQFHEFDAVVAQYHDQGHIASKIVDFWGGVNITLGLPIIRTSVDHGTAFDIVGTGKANPASLVNAIEYARVMAKNRVRSQA